MTPDFQVVGVLRQGGNPSGAGQTCTVGTSNSIQKQSPQGWVDATAAEPGAQGRIVVLSYPPPASSISSGVSFNGRTITVEWNRGVTISDAVAE